MIYIYILCNYIHILYIITYYNINMYVYMYDIIWYIIYIYYIVSLHCMVQFCGPPITCRLVCKFLRTWGTLFSQCSIGFTVDVPGHMVSLRTLSQRWSSARSRWWDEGVGWALKEIFIPTIFLPLEKECSLYSGLNPFWPVLLVDPLRTAQPMEPHLSNSAQLLSAPAPKPVGAWAWGANLQLVGHL